jgi:hypothetical protein
VIGRIRSIEKSSDLIGNRILDLPACSIVPQPTMPPRAPLHPVLRVKECADFVACYMPLAVSTSGCVAPAEWWEWIWKEAVAPPQSSFLACAWKD